MSSKLQLVTALALCCTLYVTPAQAWYVTDRMPSFERGYVAFLLEDYDKAYTLFSRMAALNDIRSQLALSLMYENGLGVEKNVELAKQWYDSAQALEEARLQAFLAEQAVFPAVP